jgi:anhydro-N-acetylmuramic acid kinase
MTDDSYSLGIMSGTSCDGVTAALIETAWPPRAGRLRVAAWGTSPYPRALREALLGIASLRAPALCALHARLGRAFARAARRMIVRSRIPASRLTVIGSHGHTAWHAGRAGTFQIGDAAAVAAALGVPVVSDFRAADVAAGGQGAPLVPWFDWLLFRPPSGAVAVQNLGGIANVTVVTPRLDGVTAFDTGPGVMLIDEAARRATRGRMAFDRDGRIAARGAIDRRAAADALAHPWFRRRPPKTTGRELFGAAFLDRLAARHPRLRGPDLVRTMAHVTAASIADACRRFVLPRGDLRVMILCGGGARHPAIVADLRVLLGGIPVRTTDDFGVPAEAKEAAAFAVLALARLRGEPANLPRATGARRPAVLGAMYAGR